MVRLPGAQAEPTRSPSGGNQASDARRVDGCLNCLASACYRHCSSWSDGRVQGRSRGLTERITISKRPTSPAVDSQLLLTGKPSVNDRQTDTYICFTLPQRQPYKWLSHGTRRGTITIVAATSPQDLTGAEPKACLVSIDTRVSLQIHCKGQ